MSLPDEILSEIFSRLSAKTVGKFRCLSKTWNTHLTSSHFIKLHLFRITNQEESLILILETNTLRIIKSPTFENSKELDLGEDTQINFAGSCNGIVLLVNQEKENDMILVNPTTLEQLKVPFIEFKCFGIGFGYDCFSHDYKILTFHGNIEVDMYSVKLGIWRRINHTVNSFNGFGYSVFVNGCLNWCMESRKSGVLFTILAFDLATDVFREIDVPMNSCGPCPPRGVCKVFTQGGRLCVLVPLKKGMVEIWMMKEYEKVNSWTKLASVADNRKWWMYKPLWVGKSKVMLIAMEMLCDEEAEEVEEDEEIEVVTMSYMIEYNMQDRTMKKMVVDWEGDSLHDGLSFVDSLVSLREFTSAS